VPSRKRSPPVRNILLAMATGTGKTRLAIALMYELLRAKRFRRILFLVDRNALGRQTLDAMSTTDTSGFLKFDQVFPVADMAKQVSPRRPIGCRSRPFRR
jgi:type I restriction enzyme R subunit